MRPPALDMPSDASCARQLDQWISATDESPELHIPSNALPAWLDQALALANAGRLTEALTLIEKNQDQLEVRHQANASLHLGLRALVLARIYWQGQRLAEARRAFDSACDTLEHALVFNEAARFYSQQGDREKAMELRSRALAQWPDNALVEANLGEDLIAGGRFQEGIGLLEQAVQRAPRHPVLGSTWLSCLHYAEQLDRDSLFAAHRKWGALHAAEVTPPGIDHQCDPERRLRIGYVSPDFCQHSVAYFFEPLLDSRPRDQYEVFGYGAVSVPDDMTTHLAGKFDGYRAIHSMSDKTVADLVHQDGIDILVDLGGHFRGHRLGVFVRRPAPVQVTYLGYPDTTGLSQIDYRLTDPWADLPDADRFYTEHLWPLPGGFLCFRPPRDAPPVGPLPTHRAGHITFGSFNNNCKISQQILNLWARILHSVPRSRMILKFKGGDSPALKERYVLAFERLGVSRGRIEVLGWRARQDHLNAYNRVDLALDTYPYNGTATTCEALWMGVPTLTLVGQHHASRVGLSLLTRAGLDVFVAHDPQAYVDKAVSFVAQGEALDSLRGSLRASLLGSALCDARGIGCDLAQAYRAMWRRYCQT